jgi:hypothetical protein
MGLFHAGATQALLPEAIPFYDDLRRRRRLHRYALHVRSSQAFALNLFTPLSKDAIVAVLNHLGLDAVEADGPEFEYEDERDLLGEASRRSGHRTQVDVVLRGRDDQHRALVALVEVKLTETDFSGCSAYLNPANPTRDVCRNDGIFGGQPELCFQLNNHGQGRRQYDHYLRSAPNSAPSNPNTDGGCLVRAGLNQPMRNLALAHALLDAVAASHTVYVLTAPRGHAVIWRRIAELQSGFPDTQLRQIRPLAAETVAELHPDGGERLRALYPSPVLSPQEVTVISPEVADRTVRNQPRVSDDEVQGLADLLRLTGAADLHGLSNLANEYLDADAWIPPLGEQDDLPNQLLLRVGNGGTHLQFPFVLADFWEVLDEMEAEVETHFEDEAAPVRPDDHVVHNEQELLALTGAADEDTLALQLFSEIDGAVHLEGDDGLVLFIGMQTRDFTYPFILAELRRTAHRMEAIEEKIHSQD